MIGIARGVHDEAHGPVREPPYRRQHLRGGCARLRIDDENAVAANMYRRVRATSRRACRHARESATIGSRRWRQTEPPHSPRPRAARSPSRQAGASSLVSGRRRLAKWLQGLGAFRCTLGTSSRHRPSQPPAAAPTSSRTRQGRDWSPGDSAESRPPAVPPRCPPSTDRAPSGSPGRRRSCGS